jgi:hypothetical protein
VGEEERVLAGRVFTISDHHVLVEININKSLKPETEYFQEDYMFEFIKNALGIFGDSVKILYRYPKFAVPLFMVWLILAPVTLYFHFFFHGAGYTMPELLLLVFGVIYLFSLLFTFSCVMLLELMQQHETGKEFSLPGAFAETIRKDLIGILVIALIWAIVWFILAVLKALTSRGRGRRSSGASPREAATVLAGGGGVFSWIGLGISMLQKLVRMTVFMILPAVAWEDKNVGSAIGRGLHVLRVHAGEFLASYAGTELAELVVFAPAILAIILVKNAPDTFWYLVIVYTAVAWTFSMYLEQMTVALLFLWHKKWEAAAGEAEKSGKPVPHLEDVPRPSLFDDVNDLATSAPDR